MVAYISQQQFVDKPQGSSISGKQTIVLSNPDPLAQITDFYDRWAGLYTGQYQHIRTKRNREAWKLIKDIALRLKEATNDR